jgi:hypothetical protein
VSRFGGIGSERGPVRAVRSHIVSGEDIVLVTRLHFRTLLRSVLNLVAVAALGYAISRLFDGSDIALTIAAGATGLVALRLVWRFLRWRSHRFIVTTHRLIEMSGVFGRRMSSVHLAAASELRYRRPPLGALLRYGEVSFVAEGRNHRMAHLSRPREMHRAIAGAISRTAVPERKHRESSPTRTYTRSSDAAMGAPLAVAEGRVFSGRYLLTRKIAAGGMGTVYEGIDRRLARVVAIKLLKEEIAADKRFVERFRREACSAAALTHPNIALIFDYGEEGSTSYIVMELVRGLDLDRVLEEEAPLALGRCVRITSAVLEALEHAHGAGVIHRDVKPANVIVGDGDRIKVTDFGIARAAGESRLTGTGVILGSAHYVSPEQVAGRPSLPQSDVYSAGIMLYEMLTGERPFEGESLLQIAKRHVTDDVGPPSARNPEIPAALDEVVLRATARGPEERFGSAAEMMLALARWAKGGAREGTQSERLTPPLRERVLDPETDTPRLAPESPRSWGARTQLKRRRA